MTACCGLSTKKPILNNMPFDNAWEIVHQQRVWGQRPDIIMMEMIGANFPISPDITILDLGCGVGAQSVALAELGFKVVAIDGSGAAIDNLKGRLTEKTEKLVTPIATDVTYFDWMENSVDCIIDVASLEYLTANEAKCLMHRAKKWLRKGGRVFSKAACEPFDLTVNPTPYIRLTNFKELYNIFQDYSIACQRITEIVRGNKEVTHYYVHATQQ